MLYASLIDRAAEESEFRTFLRTGEVRQLGYGADDAGGVLAPKSFADKVWMRLKESWLRQYATVVPCSRSFQAAYINTEPTVGVRTPAATTGVLSMGTESAPSFQLPSFNATTRELSPRFMTVSTYVSRELLEDSATGAVVENVLAMAFARKLAEEEHRQALIGTGNAQYLGIRQAAIDGSQTVTAAATTTIALNDWRGMIEKVGAGVYQNACWILSPHLYVHLSSFATSATHGLGSWSTHYDDGKIVQTLFGRPVHMSAHIDTPATGSKYSAILADLSQYLIAESSEFRVDRFDEWDSGTLGAAKNQVLFLGRMRTDGALLDPRNAAALVHT